MRLQTHKDLHAYAKTDHDVIQSYVEGGIRDVNTRFYSQSMVSFRHLTSDIYDHIKSSNPGQAEHFNQYFVNHNKNGTLPTRKEWEAFLIEFNLLGL